MSTTWFEDNLNNDLNCQQYLKNHYFLKILLEILELVIHIIPKQLFMHFLKDRNFSDKDIINSNVIKKDKVDRIRDFFYKKINFSYSK